MQKQESTSLGMLLLYTVYHFLQASNGHRGACKRCFQFAKEECEDDYALAPEKSKSTQRKIKEITSTVTTLTARRAQQLHKLNALFELKAEFMTSLNEMARNIGFKI